MKVREIVKKFDKLIRWTADDKKGGMMVGYIPNKGNLLIPEDVRKFLTKALADQQAEYEEKEKPFEDIVKKSEVYIRLADRDVKLALKKQQAEFREMVEKMREEYYPHEDGYKALDQLLEELDK